MRALDTRGKLKVRAELLAEIWRALQYRDTLVWGSGKRVTYTRLLREMGVELVTKTAAKRRGHEIRRRQHPIALAYFNAPIQRTAELYIVGIQTRPIAVVPDA
jgi:hypothetical protein